MLDRAVGNGTTAFCSIHRPVGAVTDATILSKLVDATVLVVQAHQTPKEVVRRRAVPAASRRRREYRRRHPERLRSCTAADYGYQHYYYYRGYGYGSDVDEEAKA